MLAIFAPNCKLRTVFIWRYSPGRTGLLRLPETPYDLKPSDELVIIQYQNERFRNVDESVDKNNQDILSGEGRPVHSGMAIFTPTVDAQGNLSVSVRVDRRITSALNAPGAFTGKINNSANIGKTSGEIAALWNEANPDDLINLGPASAQ